MFDRFLGLVDFVQDWLFSDFSVKKANIDFAFRDTGDIPRASIVGVTQPLVPSVSTAEELVAYAARVSSPQNQNNLSTAGKLLAYCIKNKHWSVFETVSITMEVFATRDIARQLLRHRSFTFQEFSQRYADPTFMNFVTREARLQDNKNRQNSIPTDDEKLHNEWVKRQRNVVSLVLDNYRWALKKGIAKEQARAVLPEGMTVSHLYVQGTLRSWIHYCALRMGNGTQKEHRELASMCWNELAKHFPVICAAVDEFGVDGSIEEKKET